MKWTKLDGFNQPNGLTLMRWNDYFDDGKVDGYKYALGNYANETLYFYNVYYTNKVHQLHITQLMDDDACFLDLENCEEPE